MPDRAPLPPEWLRSEARRLYGLDPVAYESGRPEYPERVYTVLVERCGLGPKAKVLEIGPGTGRVTRRLLALGAQVVAVEPDTGLAAHLNETINSDSLEVVAGSFEDAQLAADEFDLAVAAMSFHWVDQDVGLPKLSQIVRPGGWVALWWTIFGDPTRPDPFREATSDLLGETIHISREQQFELDLEHRKDDLKSRAGLVDVEGELMRWTARMDVRQLRALYASMIKMLSRPQDERERLLDRIVEVANGEFGGVVERPFVSALYTGRRP